MSTSPNSVPLSNMDESHKAHSSSSVSGGMGSADTTPQVHKLKISAGSTTSTTSTDLSSNSTTAASPASVVAPSTAPKTLPQSVMSALPSEETAAEEARRQAALDRLTKERNDVLNRWADPKTLGLTTEEVRINAFLRTNLRYLFGQTGFDPPVPARNPVSVSMHNPRFAVAMWALNTEAYRRRGALSRSQKEVVALGISLSNQCPHCAYIHTAMGPAAGDDVKMSQMQTLYQTRDADIAFPPSEDRESVLHSLAKWSLAQRDADLRTRPLPATDEQTPEVLGTIMLFGILNRVVDAFVSQDEAGPMFPLPVRFFMRFTSVAPMIQRMMSAMMSWMMHGEDAKIPPGGVLKDINKITPIVKGFEGATDEPPLEVPAELSWAAGDPFIGPAIAFLAAEAELLAWTHVPDTITPYMRYWVSRWDGTMAPSVSRETWLEPAVSGWINIKERSKLDEDDDGEDGAAVAMLRLMIVTVVASYTIDDDLLSECQAYHGVRATHAAVHWAAFLASQRAAQMAAAKPSAAAAKPPSATATS